MINLNNLPKFYIKESTKNLSYNKRIFIKLSTNKEYSLGEMYLNFGSGYSVDLIKTN